MTLRLAFLWIVCGALLAGCDNVGRAFDPNSTGGGGGSVDDATKIQAVPVGGDVAPAAPAIKVAYPKGAGWPGTTPAIVVFNSSMNQDSINPTGQGAKPTVYVRAKGTTNPIAASYDYLFGSTVLVMRPLASLPKSSGGGTTGQPAKDIAYEIVVEPDTRDIDGRRFGGSAPTVAAEFTPNQDVTAVKDGQIVAVLPEDARRDVPRESAVVAVFSKPAASGTVTSSTFLVGPRGGTALTGKLDNPIGQGQGGDGRIARFTPKDILPAATELVIEFTNGIQFGDAKDGKLDFDNRTPYSKFTTAAFAAPQSVKVGNFTTGYPDKINVNNLETCTFDVAVDASAAANDTINVRVYGLDPKTKNTTDINFVERSTRLVADGAQTVSVDFTGALGTVAVPRFTEGTLTLATQLERGSRRSGYVLSATTNKPTLDVTRPTLVSVGPPAGTGTNEIVTDLDQFAFSGKASEKLGEATLTTGSATASLFASGTDGRFLLRPIDLGRRTAPSDYTLTVVDAAGNLASAAVTGQIVQRGAITGWVAGGTLVVEAFDDATLRPLANVLVLVEPGLPQKPAVGRVTATTGSDGRATFSGLTAPTHTVTLLASGFHVKTLLATPAGFASLPLVSQTAANAFASLAGSAVFTAATGQTALIGSNLLTDASVQVLQSTTAAPTSIPKSNIRPSRLHALTVFAGSFEPIATATYSFAGSEILGTDGLTPSVPKEVPAAGQTLSPALTLLTAATGTLNLAATYGVDFGAAAGLDTGNLAAKPTVRFMSSLKGFEGMTLLGVGYTTADAGTNWIVNGTYALTAAAQLAPLNPVIWVSTEARDRSGNLTRHRRLILDNATGVTYATGAPIGIPTLQPPGGASTGSPSVTFEDRLDPAQIIGGNAFQTLTATDPAGRTWSLVRQDGDAAVGPVTIQWPDLAGETGLATGSWSVRAESVLFFAIGYGPGDFMLEELRRQEVMYARSAAVTFTVN